MTTLVKALLRPTLAAAIALLPSIGSAQNTGTWTYLEDLNAQQVAMSYTLRGEEVLHFWCFGSMKEIQIKTDVVGGRHHKSGDLMRLQLNANGRNVQVDTFHSERDGQLFEVKAMIPTNSAFFPNLLQSGQFSRAVIGQPRTIANEVDISAALPEFQRFFGTCAAMQFL